MKSIFYHYQKLYKVKMQKKSTKVSNNLYNSIYCYTQPTGISSKCLLLISTIGSDP